MTQEVVRHFSLLMQAIEHTDFYFGGYKLITDQSTLTLQKPIL